MIPIPKWFISRNNVAYTISNIFYPIGYVFVLSLIVFRFCESTGVIQNRRRDLLRCCFDIKYRAIDGAAVMYKNLLRPGVMLPWWLDIGQLMGTMTYVALVSAMLWKRNACKIVNMTQCHEGCGSYNFWRRQWLIFHYNEFHENCPLCFLLDITLKSPPTTDLSSNMLKACN